ncbi:Os03g0556500, partial [Oryza sativa Japonica Group]
TEIRRSQADEQVLASVVELPHVKQIGRPHEAPLGVRAGDVGTGVGAARAVAQAAEPALLQAQRHVNRRVRRLRQLHIPRHGEPVAAGTVERRAPDAPAGPVTQRPCLGVPRLEPLRAAAHRRLLDVADAVGTAGAVGLALVHGVRREDAPRPRRVDPHQPLDLPRRVHHEPRQDRRAVVHLVPVVCLVGRRHVLVAQEGVRPEVRHAGELVPVPRAAAVRPRGPPVQEKLRRAARVDPEGVLSGGRVIGRPPRVHVPVKAGAEVDAKLHAGEQSVGRVVKALPRNAGAGEPQHEVAVVKELRLGAAGAQHRSRHHRRRPHDPALPVHNGKAPIAVDLERGRAADHRALTIGDPHDGPR